MTAKARYNPVVLNTPEATSSRLNRITFIIEYAISQEHFLFALTRHLNCLTKFSIETSIKRFLDIEFRVLEISGRFI